MIPIEEARSYVLAGCPVLAPTPTPAADAVGLVLAERIVASEAVPPFDNTAVDGFAVVAADTTHPPVELTVAGTLPAGSAPDRAVGSGEAIRIMTGAPIPPGADAVVMVERTEVREGSGRVTVLETVRPGDNVRRSGDDLTVGQVVFEAGEVVTAGHVGVLASLGVYDVVVHRRPRVGVISTGDELVDGPGPLAPGQIRDSNRCTLLALLQDAGVDGVDLGLIPDDEAAIEAALLGAVDRCDAIVSSGGVSMGDFDYVKVVLDRVADMRWMQVAIKPAKPLAFGTITRPAGAPPVPVFGLPGNAVSSMVSFELFCRPGLRRMLGRADPLVAPLVAVTSEPLHRRPDGKLHFLRTVATSGPDGRYRVRSAGGQGSHQLWAMANANALALVPDGDGLDEGDPVEILLLRP